MRLTLLFILCCFAFETQAQYNVLELRHLDGYKETNTAAIYENSFFILSSIKFHGTDNRSNYETHQFETVVDSSIYDLIGEPIALGAGLYDWKDNQLVRKQSDVPDLANEPEQTAFPLEQNTAVGTITVLDVNDSVIRCLCEFFVVDQSDSIVEYYKGITEFQIIDLSTIGVTDYRDLPRRFRKRRRSSFEWTDTNVKPGASRVFDISFMVINRKLTGGKNCNQDVCLDLADNGQTIDSITTFLLNNPNISVEIRAHAELRGHEVINELYSTIRAQALVDELHSRGVSEDRLSFTGMGKTTPLIKEWQVKLIRNKAVQELAYRYSDRFEMVVK